MAYIIWENIVCFVQSSETDNQGFAIYTAKEFQRQLVVLSSENSGNFEHNGGNGKQKAAYCIGTVHTYLPTYLPTYVCTNLQTSHFRISTSSIASHPGPQDGNDYLYDVVSVFHAVSGGDWAQRPALFDTLWRVKNLEVTYGQWSFLASIRRQVHTGHGDTPIKGRYNTGQLGAAYLLPKLVTEMRRRFQG